MNKPTMKNSFVLGLGFFLGLVLSQQTSATPCTMRDGESYQDCDTPIGNVQLCMTGSLGQGSVLACHNIPNRRGYCCKVDGNPNCRGGANGVNNPKIANKWYRLYIPGWSYCKKIQVKPPETSQCSFVIAKNACPFLNRAQKNVLAKHNFASGTPPFLPKTKRFWMHALGGDTPGNPKPEQFLDPYDDGLDDTRFADDDPLGTLFTSHNRVFNLDRFILRWDETTSTPGNEDYYGGQHTTAQFIDFSVSPPVPTANINAVLTAPPYNMALSSDPTAIVKNLYAGKAVSFIDTTADSLTGDDRRDSCENDRVEFWRKFCTRISVEISRRVSIAVGARCDPDGSIPATCTYHHHKFTEKEPPPGKIDGHWFQVGTE